MNLSAFGPGGTEIEDFTLVCYTFSYAFRKWSQDLCHELPGADARAAPEESD